MTRNREAAGMGPVTEPLTPRRARKIARMKKEMLINVLQPEECRIAIVEDGILEELYVERTSLESYTGNIYKGKVVNLEPAIQAAFIDFSVGRNGFLHVSDVEPQYYQRHLSDDAELGARDRGRDTRRERDEPRPPRADDRGPRDRPDRSERGRREPRRFGEGLVEEPWGEPPAPVRPAPPPHPPRVEPERPPSRPVEAEAPRGGRQEEPSIGWSDEPPPPRPPERQARAAEPEEPRVRTRPPVEAFEGDLPDLPPSRTGNRRASPRPADLDAPEPPRARAVAPPRELESEPPAPADARRGRGGRGRGGRTAREPEPRADFEPETREIPEVEPLAGDFPEPAPRRGGRSAIRSRGGDREPARPRELAPERPPEPELDRLPAYEPERIRAIEPERPGRQSPSAPASAPGRPSPAPG